ncbi:hypothetical protein [Candidatus Oscillochloris fontis]|uniref:hypothetical protein n=1 Tax=Candidatus Oscillochloris fontis TaxID=2496868 RepID=UPI00101C2157|nr:hypothetical protein [Candidatus Oscillochloris fontis]
MAHRFSRPLVQVVILLLALSLVLPTGQTSFAQDDSRYFPETGHSVGGSFRSFWEANGGIAIFGFPISAEFVAANGRTMQWFERARFELADVNGQLQVQLGNLGAEVTQNRIFPKVPPIENSADQRYIPETQHIIKYGFKEIWETRGDVRIFGYPLSEEIDEILEDGEWHTVQYFERARFEYWPNLPPGERVLLSHLGRKLASTDLTNPGTPAPTPVPVPTLPPNVNATVTPQSGPPGTSFAFSANGFTPGERVGIWITLPDQSTSGADFQVTADGSGGIGGDSLAITTAAGDPTGIWSFNAQGVSSGKQAVGYFFVGGTASAPPGNTDQLGVPVHDQLPTQGLVMIAPVAAPSGTLFEMYGGGFTAGEQVSAWITKPDGQSQVIPQVAIEGTVAYTLIDTTGLPDGVYQAVIQGRSSNVVAAASFKLTRDYVAGPGTARPASVNGGSTPPEGPGGTTFQIRGWGFNPSEPVEVWTTNPSGYYVLQAEPMVTDTEGRIGYVPAIDLHSPAGAQSGLYAVHFRSKATGKRVDVYFTVTGNTQAQSGAGNWEILP